MAKKPEDAIVQLRRMAEKHLKQQGTDSIQRIVRQLRQNEEPYLQAIASKHFPIRTTITLASLAAEKSKTIEKEKELLDRIEGLSRELSDTRQKKAEDDNFKGSNMTSRYHTLRWKWILGLLTVILCLWGMTWHVSGEDPGKGKAITKPSKVLPIAGEVFRVEGHTAFLILSTQRASGHPTPWVWYAPTLEGLPGPEEQWMCQKFLDAGIAIAGIDVGESYGSPVGRSLYSALYEDLVRRRGFSEKACLLARSRGGLMLYNWAAEHPASVACIAGIYPVCNLSSYPGLKKACGAYSMTEEQLAAKACRA